MRRVTLFRKPYGASLHRREHSDQILDRGRFYSGRTFWAAGIRYDLFDAVSPRRRKLLATVTKASGC
jgi:hypothetical protein